MQLCFKKDQKRNIYHLRARLAVFQGKNSHESLWGNSRAQVKRGLSFSVSLCVNLLINNQDSFPTCDAPCIDYKPTCWNWSFSRGLEFVIQIKKSSRWHHAGSAGTVTCPEVATLGLTSWFATLHFYFPIPRNCMSSAKKRSHILLISAEIFFKFQSNA